MQKTGHTVNAFTANNENGNPAGVIVNADTLNEALMLATALQAGLSETAFIQSSRTATRKVRFFTPTTEVDLCGHATIAAWSLLYKLGHIPAGEYTQETKAGILKVTVQSNGLTFMEQAKAEFFEKINPKDIINLLGITTSDLHNTLKPQIVSTGIKDLLIPVIDTSVLSKIRPNLEATMENPSSPLSFVRKSRCLPPLALPSVDVPLVHDRHRPRPLPVTVALNVQVTAETDSCRDRDVVARERVWVTPVEGHGSETALVSTHSRGLHGVILSRHMRSAVDKAHLTFQARFKLCLGNKLIKLF